MGMHFARMRFQGVPTWERRAAALRILTNRAAVWYSYSGRGRCFVRPLTEGGVASVRGRLLLSEDGHSQGYGKLGSLMSGGAMSLAAMLRWRTVPRLDKTDEDSLSRRGRPPARELLLLGGASARPAEEEEFPGGRTPPPRQTVLVGFV